MNLYYCIENKAVRVIQGVNKLTGVAAGVNELGQLILNDSLGVKHILSSGDTSLHTDS
ncbi:MAG: hypothetical protein H0U75_04645 [Legionella sp.]|nr:hypothetical protein [Legionella sp.]